MKKTTALAAALTLSFCAPAYADQEEICEEYGLWTHGLVIHLEKGTATPELEKVLVDLAPDGINASTMHNHIFTNLAKFNPTGDEVATSILGWLMGKEATEYCLTLPKHGWSK